MNDRVVVKKDIRYYITVNKADKSEKYKKINGKPWEKQYETAGQTYWVKVSELCEMWLDSFIGEN